MDQREFMRQMQELAEFGRTRDSVLTKEESADYCSDLEIREEHMELVEKAVEAMEEQGIQPVITPIRGGTDGARLSFMGLPCPNLCTGGENCHGKFEYACVQSMEKIVKLLTGLVGKFL